MYTPMGREMGMGRGNQPAVPAGPLAGDVAAPAPAPPPAPLRVYSATVEQYTLIRFSCVPEGQTYRYCCTVYLPIYTKGLAPQRKLSFSRSRFS